jgi:hypothetical protein
MTFHKQSITETDIATVVSELSEQVNLPLT